MDKELQYVDILTILIKNNQLSDAYVLGFFNYQERQ